jgi:hypothetical protein
LKTWGFHLLGINSSFGFKFKTTGAEIKKQTEVEFARCEVVYQLNRMGYSKSFDGLYFDDQTIFYKKVRIKVTDLNVFI